MSDEKMTPQDAATSDQPLTIEQQEEIAKTYEFAPTDQEIEKGLGNIGGAGATGGIEPDIAPQSRPASINSSDLPSK